MRGVRKRPTQGAEFEDGVERGWRGKILNFLPRQFTQEHVVFIPAKAETGPQNQAIDLTFCSLFIHSAI